MLEFNAPLVVQLCQKLQAIEISLIQHVMSDDLSPENIVGGMWSKKQKEEWKNTFEKNKESGKKLRAAIYQALGASLNQLEEECNSLGLDFCALELKRAKKKYEEEGSLKPADINVISIRLLDELSIRKFIQIEPHESEYYEPQQPLFGEIVAKEFPNASYDIMEAGKCYALGRSTACVFHIMRVIEAGMLKLATHLEIVRTPSGWNGFLEKIKNALDSLPSGTQDEKNKRKNFERAHAHLNAIRLAWRNDTMHPVETYTIEEAKDLMQHTKLFMHSLGANISA